MAERRMTRPKPAAPPPDRRRSSYLQLADFVRLEEWCQLVRQLFDGEAPYLVGSVNERPDWRDVDLRLILDDDAFDAWGLRNVTKLRMLNRAVSAWGHRDTGLPIDFQVQQATAANAAFDSFRNPMGIREDFAFVRPAGTPHERRHR